MFWSRYRFKGKKINREVDDLEILEIKTFGLVLEFEISFHQQQHSVAFVLLYSDLDGRWDLSFLTEVIAQI